MTTNEIIRDLHSEAVRKAAINCHVEGNKKKALEIGTDIIEYGKLWVESFSDDGSITADEEKYLCETFNHLITKYVPDVDHHAVGWAWNGLSFFGLGWKGLKSYVNKWFGFDL